MSGLIEIKKIEYVEFRLKGKLLPEQIDYLELCMQECKDNGFNVSMDVVVGMLIDRCIATDKLGHDYGNVLH